MYVGQPPTGISGCNFVHYAKISKVIPPVYVGQHPAGTSGKNIVYYVQVSNVVFLCM